MSLTRDRAAMKSNRDYGDAARISLLVAAFVIGALAYRDHFLPETPVWRWGAEWLAGTALLTISLGGAAAPQESSLRRWLRRGAGAICFLAAGTTFHFLPQPGHEVATAVAVAIAVSAFLLWRWVPFAPEDVAALLGSPPASEAPRLSHRALRAVGATAAIATAAAAACVNHAHHTGGLLLWLASLIGFAAAMWERHSPPDSPARPRITSGGPSLPPRAANLAFGLVLALAVGLRVPLLAEVPVVIDPDEGRIGRHAERIWNDGFPNAFDIGWNVFPHLSFMVDYVGVQALGSGIGNLRLSAAAVGVLSIVPMFYWVRRWWGDVTALIAAALLAVNFQHINFSRIAFLNIQQVLVAALILFTFARGLQTRRRSDWVYSGYAAGLAFHTYHAAKLFPLLLALAAVILAIGIPFFVRRYWRCTAVAAVAFLLCVGPLMLTMPRRWEEFYGGTSNRFEVARLIDAHGRGDIPAVREFLHFHVAGNLFSFISVPSSRYATFDPFVVVPFVLGTGWMLWRWRDPRHLVVLVWSAGILVAGGMATDFPPAMTRMIGFLPAVCAVPAVVAGRVRATLTSLLGRTADLVFVPVLFVWLAAALVYNTRTVFEILPAERRGDPMTEICRIIDGTPVPATFFTLGVGGMAEPKTSAHDCMIAPRPDRWLINLPDDPSVVPIPPTGHGTVTIIVEPNQRELLPLIRHYYPRAESTVVHDPLGAPILHVFRMAPAEVERDRGLRATYRSRARVWSPESGVAPFVPPAGAEFPVDARWYGQILLPAPGSYAFRAAGATLRVGGRPAADEGPLTLAAGWHPIEAAKTFRNAQDRAVLEWRPQPSAPWATVPVENLHVHAEPHGLVGRYFGGSIDPPPANRGATPIPTPPDFTRIEVVPSFDYHFEADERPVEPFAARPSTMEWTGSVHIPEGTTRRLRLESTTPTEVFLNGALVLKSAGGPAAPPNDTTVAGTTGRVPILVRTVRSAQDDWRYWKMRLLWGTSDGSWTAFVPYYPPEPVAAAEETSATQAGSASVKR